MQKLINALDFMKGYKTKTAGFFLLGSLLLNLVWKLDISEKELGDVFWLVIEQAEVIVGAVGVAYGAIMKLVRK